MDSSNLPHNDLVLAQLPYEGAESGPSPNEIAKILTDSGRETTNTSVSATLSRMKNDEGIAVKINGQWFRNDAGAKNAAAQKETAPAGAAIGDEARNFV